MDSITDQQPCTRLSDKSLAALKASEERYRNLVEMSPEAIFINRQNKVVFINHACLRVFGAQNPEQLLGKSPFDLFHENYHEKMKERIEKLLQGRPAPLIQAKGKRLDGTPFDCEVVASPFLDQGIRAIQVLVRDLSEISKMVKKMRESEERFRLMFESHKAVMLLIDPENGYIIDANKAAIDFYGYSKDSLARHRIQDINQLPPHKVEEEYRKAAREHQQYFVFPHKLANGQVRWVEVYSSPFFNQGKNLLFSIIHDITERKQAELEREAALEALHQSEERFAKSFTQSSIALSITRFDGTIIDVNERILSLFEMTREEVIGRKSTEINIYQPGERKKIMRVVKEQGLVRNYETTMRTKSGKLFTILFSANIINLNGIDHLLTSMIDVSERKQAKEALQQSESKFRQLFENITELVALFKVRRDQNGKIINRIVLEANKAFLNVAKASSLSAVKGKTSEEIFGGGNISPILDFTKKALDTGTALSFEWKATDNLYLMMSVIPLDKDHYISTARDITPLKQAEEILRRDKESLEKLVTEKTRELIITQQELENSRRLSDIGTLAATVAHELRNPLAAIQLAVHNIGRKNTDPKLQKRVSLIDNKLKEGNQIINNLLFYSRLKTPHYESIRLAETLKETAHMFKGPDQKKQVQIEIKFKPNHDITIQADPIQLRELLNNLIHNAYDALPPENGLIKIRVEKLKNQVEIKIKDNGSGMDEETLARIREPFFSTKSKGTGLGLAVCDQIIKLHNWEMDFQSQPSQGTQVTLKIPQP